MGQNKSNFNYNLDEKRVLNFENVVDDSDNVKQDMSIDVYGRQKDEEAAASDDATPNKSEAKVCSVEPKWSCRSLALHAMPNIQCRMQAPKHFTAHIVHLKHEQIQLCLAAHAVIHCVQQHEPIGINGTAV